MQQGIQEKRKLRLLIFKYDKAQVSRSLKKSKIQEFLQSGT